MSSADLPLAHQIYFFGVQRGLIVAQIHFAVFPWHAKKGNVVYKFFLN